MDEIFAWVVTIVGCFGFWLGGKKIWWSWYVNIANQLAWVIFALITGYYAFLVGTAFYLTVFVRNAYLWTKEHFADEPAPRYYTELYPCGNICRRDGVSPWACTRQQGHDGRHGYGGIFWGDEEGEPFPKPIINMHVNTDDYVAALERVKLKMPKSLEE